MTELAVYRACPCCGEAVRVIEGREAMCSAQLWRERRRASTFTFVVRGPLRGKGRPRFVRATGRTYTPAETLSAEQRIQAVAHAEGVKPLEGFVRLRVIAVKAPAASWSKRKRAEALAGHYDARKPDADNVLKLVMDSLNGVAWADDVQVVDASVERRIDEGGERLVIQIQSAREATP